MIYTPSGGPVTEYNEFHQGSPYQHQTQSQAPYIPSVELSPVGGRQYNSELGPGLGRKSPSQIAASLAWLNTYPFLLVMAGLAILAVISGAPEAALVAAYGLPFLFVRYFWRYFRYSAQTSQVYALG